MKDLFYFFKNRIKRDGLALEAGALAFSSILALIPALSVVFSLFTMVPAFTPIKESLINFAQENFVPVFSKAMGDYISNFINSARSMTFTGVILLIIISLFLIKSVDSAFNRIWRGGKRKFSTTIALYWTLLTIGPLSLGVIVYITSKVLALSFFENMHVTFAIKLGYFLIPFFIEILLVMVLYLAVPQAKVRYQDAFIGAFLVTIIFEVSKKVFQIWITNFSDYEAIYGALAAIPVIMLWIYIGWWILLLGAEFTSCLGIVRQGQTENIPLFIQKIANVTGDTLGCTRVKNKKSNINIKINRNNN